MTDTTSRAAMFSLRWRLTLLLALATAIALGSAAWIVDWRADSEMQQRFDSALLTRAQAFTELVRLEGGRIQFVPRAEPAAVFPGNANTSWYEVRCGAFVVARTPHTPPPMDVGASPRFADVRTADGRKLRVVSLRFSPANDDPSAAPPAVCALRYALDRDPLDDILGALDIILLGSLFGVCAVVLALTPLLVHRGLRPLSALAGAMADIGPDEPGRRLPHSGTRELAPLVERFNEVLARMDAGLARERDFAAGLAHELRTRLAELRTLVDVEARYPSGRDARVLLGEVGAIGAELESTVAALLQLTRIESGLAQVRAETIQPLPLLARARTRHMAVAAQRGVRIDVSTSMDAAATIRADTALTEIILDNLLGNAITYAPASSTVLIRADANALEVVNSAPQLQHQDLDRFGQRFWRKGDGGAGHTGLGLALASAAARAQKMTLKFRLDDAQCLHATLDWRCD